MILAVLLTAPALAHSPGSVLDGAWSREQVDQVLDRTLTVRLDPDLSALTDGERAAVAALLEVGGIFQRLYEDAMHPQALDTAEHLRQLDAEGRHGRRTERLLDLYRLFRGPIATTLDNRREPFLAVSPEVPGKSLYPADATRQEIEAFLAAHPAARDGILGERTVVRRASAENLARDLATLERHPALAVLHPELARELATARRTPDAARFYAVPYAVAWADELHRAHDLLRQAAGHLESDDPELARYLRNRARDLLSNDYESGDASWVTGRFHRLNAQIGAYETYDDALFGVKAFPSVSLLVTDAAASEELRRALDGLQAIEDALPYEGHKRVREDIPVGVYDVVADFGQARGTNTATILPNDPLFSRRYGRTILLRRNVMTHPDLFAIQERVWRSVVVPEQAADLVPEGNVVRTLWHEIGHYLGVDRDRHGRTLDIALGGWADALEEMKSDLVSLFANERREVDAATRQAVRASGIRRTLQSNRPRPDQPYQTMQLAQLNWFLEHGLVTVDPETTRLEIHYERYPEVVEGLLREVLRLQRQGDPAAAAAFFERWTAWSDLHETLAERARAAQGTPYRLVRYGALGE